MKFCFEAGYFISLTKKKSDHQFPVVKHEEVIVRLIVKKPVSVVNSSESH